MSNLLSLAFDINTYKEWLGVDTSSTITPLEIIVKLVNCALGFTAFFVVCYVIYGGMIYITAGGDETKIEQGTKIIRGSLTGLAIILLSGLILNFVLETVFSL